MQVSDDGKSFTVLVTAAEVASFNCDWPGSTLKPVRVYFKFDKRTGDLIDIESHGHPVDGTEGTALAHDAQQYGESTLGIVR